MALGRVKLNSGGVEEMLKSAGVRADIKARADRVLAAAQAGAPVKTGNYLNGLEVQEATTDRAVARVVGTAPHSHLVEANTGNLVRALDAAG